MAIFHCYVKLPEGIYAVFKTLYAQGTRSAPLVQALQADTWGAALLMRPGPWEIWSFDGKFQQSTENGHLTPYILLVQTML